MKFGHEFADRLVTEGYPEEWQQQAFPYRHLKKCLHGVQTELKAMGLDPATLAQLLETRTDGQEGESVPVARFDLEDPDDKGELYPRLTIILELEDGMPVNSSLSPTSRQFLQKLALRRSKPKSRQGSTDGTVRRLSVDSAGSIHPMSENGNMLSGQATYEEPSADDAGPHRETIELTFENNRIFFDTIQRDLKSLDTLEKTERQKLDGLINELHTEIVPMIRRPQKITMRKSDLTRWRQIFELYIEAQVFFSRGELDHGTRDRRTALKQLQWFQTRVADRKLVEEFKLEGSRLAYERFLQLNKMLVDYAGFQEINKMALYKIMKKFHKRTQFDVPPSSLNNIHPDFMASEVSKALCIRVTEDLATLIPPLNEYLCPVCYDIAYLPLNLPCGHLFCIRCVVKLQRRGVVACPTCREPVVRKAYIDGINADLTRHLVRYYPDKCREKEIQDRNEMGKEAWGPDYEYKKCAMM